MMAAVTNERGASRIWIALKRLDLNDDEVTIVKDVWILQGLDTAAAKQVLFHSFGLEDSIFVLKLRNSQGSLIPINSALNINSKQSPYILEVVKLFQHVVPKRRNAVLTVINKSLKNRLQSIMKRIDRLDELGPEINMKWQNKLSEEMGLLNQKLQFLDQRMQGTMMFGTFGFTGVCEYVLRLLTPTAGKACLNVHHSGEFSHFQQPVIFILDQ